MKEPIADREALWTRFLTRWPLESLTQMRLSDYAEAGSKDCFIFWMESETEALGSIWGGSAFKFGIYSRRDLSEKESTSKRRYSNQYAWYGQYGDSADEAFAQVKAEIIKVAHAAREGDLASVDKAALGQAFKWKLAFHYQDREHPCVLPIYSLQNLRASTGQKNTLQAPQLYQRLLAERGEENLFAYADKRWDTAQAWLLEQDISEQAIAHFAEQPERFMPINLTSKVAGYRLDNGKEIAVIRSFTKLTLFMQPGEWLQTVKSEIQSQEDYPPDRGRNGNLDSCAPTLANGHTAVSVELRSINSLEAVCTAYEGDPILKSTTPATGLPQMSEAPLNQILFGPPGTGKTYSTIDAALEVLAPQFLLENRNNRPALKTRFDALKHTGRIEFVTFHQSFSYEDFVEGLRADTDQSTGQIRYDVVDGVFKSMCVATAVKVNQQAEAPLNLKDRRIWKMSLGNTLGSDAVIYDECIEGNYILLGYGADIDFTGCKTRDDVRRRYEEAGESFSNPQSDYAVTSVSAFVTKMKEGDLVVVTDGNFKFRAIGEIVGKYAFKPHADFEGGYSQFRAVKWLREYEVSLPHTELMNNQFSQMTLYELGPQSIDKDKLAALLGNKSADSVGTAALNDFEVGQVFGSDYRVTLATRDVLELRKPQGRQLGLAMSLLNTLAEYVRQGRMTVEDIREKKVFDIAPDTALDPFLVNGYNNILAPLVEHLVKGSQGLKTNQAGPTNDARVLIIDEINRGNVSRIFGELITLIEQSKRDGAAEALSVVLPYSKKSFSVPKNLYLIGTMNTADRSLAGLDIALRRRFEFREMPPKPELLDHVTVEGINIGQLLRVLNQRIEVLLDRDHCIGHAYFMPLENCLPHQGLGILGRIFRTKVLPLLQEYFFEDWERIKWVLNDHRKPSIDRFVDQHKHDLESLFGANAYVPKHNAPWYINEPAFSRATAFNGVIKVENDLG
jgi:5-methylcytosine-specific restriction protein B